MKNLSKITISKVQSNEKLLFGVPTTVTKFIYLRFKEARMSNSFDSSNIFSSKTISDIYLSNEQWMNLLLNINNKNGIPCTINFRNDVDISKINNNNNNNNNNTNNYDRELNLFNKELKNIFSTVNTLKEESKKLLKLDSNSNNRKTLLTLKNKVLLEWQENKDKLQTLLNSTFNTFNKHVKDDLEKDIKNNFLGFSSIENKTKAKKLLGLIDTNLIDNLENSKTLSSIKNHGVITIEEIKSENGFVEDLNVKNGYKISVHQAKEELINDNHIITPAEVIVSVELSIAQFSNFISSFNEGDGQTTTLVETKLLGKIKKDFDNLDILDRRLEEFKTYINTTIDEQMKEQSDFINLSTSKRMGVKKSREVEISFEQFYNYLISNISFYVKKILNENLKTNISKRMDVQFVIEKTIKDLGVTIFNEKLEKEDLEDNIEVITTIRNNKNFLK